MVNKINQKNGENKSWLNGITKNAQDNINDTIKNNGLDMKALTQINTFVQTHPPLTKWSEGEIYKVPIDIDGSLKYFLVAKKRYDDETENEYKKHRHISRLMDKKDWLIKQNETKALDDIEWKVFVPNVHGHWQTPDWENEVKYIVMDYIEGKTLFNLAAEEIVWIDCENDTEAIKEIRKYAYDNEFLDFGQDWEIYNYVIDKIKQWNIKLFDEQDWIRKRRLIQRFLQHIHKNWFYHRDLWDNLRNIMIWNDDNIYIIDFGKSTIIGKNNTRSSMEERDIYFKNESVNGEDRFPQDEWILSFMDHLRIKQRPRQPWELSY